MGKAISSRWVLFFFIPALVIGAFVGYAPSSMAQDSPQAPNFAYEAYLPLISSANIKVISGVHLGNRQSDWNTPRDFLFRLKGTADGKWPAAIVVLSNQLYSINRSTSSPCNITGASIRSSVLYAYLTQAITKGTRVVIRIYPSPGNFTDYNSPGSSHTLRSDTIPAGGNYCGGNYTKFRAINDIVAEMNEIYKVNVNQNSWPMESFYFEPANEPNIEWYKIGVTIPAQDNKQAWQDMDRYFTAIYDQKQSLNSNIRLLTPSMAQNNYGEQYIFGTCQAQSVVGGGTGYDAMTNTYGVKNDGYSWHNYWRQAQEFWDNSFCSSPTDTPSSDHIFQYFPSSLQTQIVYRVKPIFVTEADLISPCFSPPNAITNKDTQAIAAQESIWRFVSQEYGATYVIAWLLTNQAQDLANGSISPTQCTADNGNYEIAWHEAYRETDERSWFSQWWLRNE